MHYDVLIPNINCDHRLKIEGWRKRDWDQDRGRDIRRRRRSGLLAGNFYSWLLSGSSKWVPQRHKHGVNLPCCLPEERHGLASQASHV